MARYQIVNDIHATWNPPGRCTDRYWPDVRDLLLQTGPVAVKYEVAGTVWAGDVFHYKAPSRTSHGLVRELAAIAAGHPVPVLAVPGNHDMQHDRPQSIRETQPLGVLFGAGVRELEGWDGPDEDARLDLFGVPWQQRWSEEAIALALEPYNERAYGCSLVVTHAPIYPPGREPGYAGAEYTPASWWADAMGNEGYLAYGHIHEPHGAWTHRGVTFCNYGALSRGSLDEYNLEREVGTVIWDSDVAEPGAFEFVPLQGVPAAELFRLAEAAAEKASAASLAEFMTEVSRTTLSVLSLETVARMIRERHGDSSPVAQLAEELLMAQQGGTR